MMVISRSAVPFNGMHYVSAAMHTPAKLECPCLVSQRFPRGLHHRPMYPTSVHLLDESIDVLFSVTKVTTLNEMLELPLPEAASRVGQLEWPQKVAGLLEIGTDGVDLVNQIFDADDAVLAEMLLNDGVVGQRNSLLVAIRESARLCDNGIAAHSHLAVAALVDELTNRLQVGIAVCNEWLDNAQHLDCRFGDLDEDAVVDLKQAEQLQGLALLRVDLVDTLDSHNESKLRLSRHMETALLLGETV